MAEELALEQVLRDRRAVQREEGLLGARAVLVDRARHQLLAGAALAGDEDGHVLVGDPTDLLVDLEHRRAAAEHRAALDGDVRVGGSQHDRRAHAPPDLDRVQHRLLELVQVDRLVEVVEGAALHRLDRRAGVLGHGDEHHRDARVDGPDLLVDLQPGLVGQTEIQEDHLGRV